MITAAQVIALASGEVGTKESPANSNRQKYGVAYGMNGVAWCAIFLWWLFHQLGADGALPKKSAGVFDLMAAFKRAGRFHSAPEPGDFAIYDYGQGHIELVESVQKTTITTIGGNTSSTSSGSQSNGGMVARRVRARDRHILGYCRPKYATTSTPTPTPVVEKVEQDMSDDAACTIRWFNGEVTKANEDGSINNTPGVPSFGSFFSLTDKEKQAVPNPPSPWALTAARKVSIRLQGPQGENIDIEVPDMNGGVVAHVIGKDGQSHSFKFDADFARTHKV